MTEQQYHVSSGTVGVDESPEGAASPELAELVQGSDGPALDDLGAGAHATDADHLVLPTTGGMADLADASPSGLTATDAGAANTADLVAPSGVPLAEAGGASPELIDEPQVTRVARHEETLRAEKTLEEIGALYVHKDVAEVEQSLNVPVRTEELNVSRRPVDRRVDGPVRVYEEGDTLVIPVVEERLEIRKVAYVVEELVIERILKEDTRTITDTIRKEQVTIEQEGQLRSEEQ